MDASYRPSVCGYNSSHATNRGQGNSLHINYVFRSSGDIIAEEGHGTRAVGSATMVTLHRASVIWATKCQLGRLKFYSYNNEIVDRDLDVCLLTETHLHLTRLSNVVFLLVSCCMKHLANMKVLVGIMGDLIAAVTNSRLRYWKIRATTQALTFECMSFILSSTSSTVAVLLINRPGFQK